MIAVIGGGMMGAVCTFRLRQAGYAVTVFEADDKGAAWPAAAGLVTPSAENLYGTPLEPLARESVRLWPELRREIEVATGQSIGWREGVTRVALAPEDAAALEQSIGEAVERSGFAAARQAAGEVRMHPPSLVAAGLTGAEVRHEKVTALRPTETGVLIQTATGEYPFDLAVVTAGVGSAAFGLPVEPQQGQALLLDVDEMDARYAPDSRYALGRPDGLYVGATSIMTTDTQPTPEAHAALSEYAGLLFPEHHGAPEKAQLVGLRPVTADNMPLIGPHPDLAHVFVATGHGRHGGLLAAYTAQKVLELVQESGAA